MHHSNTFLCRQECESKELQCREDFGYGESEETSYHIFGDRPYVSLGAGPETDSGKDLIFPTVLVGIFSVPIRFNGHGMSQAADSTTVIRDNEHVC